MKIVHAKRRPSRPFMDRFVHLAVELVKLVFKIIEGIIRALLEVAVDLYFYGICAATGLVIGFFILRNGVCEGKSCFSNSTFNNLVMMTGCALTLIAAYTIYKRLI
ncbi:uncharacterized protein LOC114362001 [Ostrinia furnacalis]|uniref:uncharacterized protein LOC114362001 n=1 Tax=Ostrinia furnacalis TaxID=93504 RepID=UPI00103FDD65|nr:uncharacterized protein LOC114362001 [Ostrinia furnacalis]